MRALLVGLAVTASASCSDIETVNNTADPVEATETGRLPLVGYWSTVSTDESGEEYRFRTRFTENGELISYGPNGDIQQTTLWRANADQTIGIKESIDSETYSGTCTRHEIEHGIRLNCRNTDGYEVVMDLTLIEE